MQFSEIIQDVIDRSGEEDTTAFRTMVKRWINQAQRKIFIAALKHRLHFLEETETISVTVGKVDYPRPADWRATRDLCRGNDRLTERDVDFADKHFDDDTSGEPHSWYPWKGKIYLYPKPKEAESLTHRYYKKITTLANDSDVSIIHEDYHELMVIYAYALTLGYQDRNTEAELSLKEFRLGLQDMVRTEKKTGTDSKYVRYVDREYE